RPAATVADARRSMLLGRRRDVGSKVGVLFVDPLAERETRVAADLDRSADLAFRFLEELSDALVRLADISLVQQADLFVEGLEPRLDDLLDDVGRLALRLELLGQDVPLARDDARVEARSVERLRI